MGYTMSVHVRDDIDTENIIKFLEDSEHLKDSQIKGISSNAGNHGYSVAPKNGKGIYISFSTLGQAGSFFIHNFFALIAKEYGQKIIYEDKEYSYFLYDDEVSLIIDDNDEYKEKRGNEFKVKVNRKKMIAGFYHYYKDIEEYDYPFSMFDKLTDKRNKFIKIIEVCNKFKNSQ